MDFPIAHLHVENIHLKMTTCMVNDASEYNTTLYILNTHFVLPYCSSYSVHAVESIW